MTLGDDSGTAGQDLRAQTEGDDGENGGDGECFHEIYLGRKTS